MEAERVMITGGCGFIGSNTCSMLLEAGYNVVCVDNLDSFYDPEIKIRNIRSFLLSPHFAFERADITDRDALDKLMKKYRPDIVIHLASKVNVRLSLDDADSYHHVNVTGTRTLLELMSTNGVTKLVFASSSSVYGPSSEEYFSESAYLKPVSPYGVSKAIAEELISEFSSRGDINAVILRFFNVYGKRLRPDLFIHKLYQAMINGHTIPIYNNGMNRKDYTFIADALSGIEGALDYLGKQKSASGIFNIGSGQTNTNEEILELTEDIFDMKLNVEYVEEMKGDVSYSRADISLASALLHYQPAWTIRDGLGLTYKQIQDENN